MTTTVQVLADSSEIKKEVGHHIQWHVFGLTWNVDTILSTLIAPLLMLSQTNAVASVLLGSDAGWGAQRRPPQSKREAKDLAQVSHAIQTG